jgi:hypothetical protein
MLVWRLLPNFGTWSGSFVTESVNVDVVGFDCNMLINTTASGDNEEGDEEEEEEAEDDIDDEYYIQRVVLPI